MTPEPVPTEEIIETEPPLAKGPTNPTWSLFALIATIVTSVIGLIMSASYFIKKKDEDGEPTKVAVSTVEDEQKPMKSKFLGLVPMAAAIVAFILTQDLSGLMTIFDKWSILFALLGIGNGALGYVTRNKTSETDTTATV